MNAPLTYLDNNATTRCDPRVVAAMQPLLSEVFGNPSSTHYAGAAAGAAVEQARAEIAARIGARESEILFTSGGTEADNTALRGVLLARPSRRHVIISAIEHAAVRDTAARLEQEGVEITTVGVDETGRVRIDELAAALRKDTALVSVMLANNETGVLQPIREIAEHCRTHGVLLHTDAVQAVGRIPVDVAALGVDYLSLSGHKLHGPKGVGALFIRRGAPLRSIQTGGPQERERRGGTLNTPGIVGLGRACALAADEMAETAAHVARLRDRLERELCTRCPGAEVIGVAAPRLPNTSCVCFAGVEAEALLLLLSEAGICVSSGSACSSGSLEPSHVMQAMGLPPHVAQGQIRFSFSRENSNADVDRVLEVLPAALSRIQRLNTAAPRPAL